MNSKYKKMLAGMEAKEAQSKKRVRDEWFLYILKCSDGSFYTGVTKDIARRFKMHEGGKASRYTRTRRPLELLYQEVCGTRTQALVREYKVKSFSKDQKLALVENMQRGQV